MVQQQVFFFLFASFVLSIFIYIYKHTHSVLLCVAAHLLMASTQQQEKKKEEDEKEAKKTRAHDVIINTPCRIKQQEREPQQQQQPLPARHTPSFSSSSSCVYKENIKERGGGQTFIIGSVILPGKWRRKRIKTRARK